MQTSLITQIPSKAYTLCYRRIAHFDLYHIHDWLPLVVPIPLIEKQKEEIIMSWDVLKPALSEMQEKRLESKLELLMARWISWRKFGCVYITVRGLILWSELRNDSISLAKTLIELLLLRDPSERCTIKGAFNSEWIIRHKSDLNKLYERKVGHSWVLLFHLTL